MYAIILEMADGLNIIQEESIKELIFNLHWYIWTKSIDDIIEENNYVIILFSLTVSD